MFSMLSLFQSAVRPLFGNFEREEFKKFLRMGLCFTFILGSYWTMRVLKNSLFSALVGAAYIPYAKTISLIILIPLLMVYSRLLDTYSREKTFYFLSLAYACATIGFALLLLHPTIGQAAKDIIALRTGFAFYGTKILGYAWYVFVESYGSLIIALFWAIASDTTVPESAKKGFSFVVAFGQFGAIFGPYFIASLPHILGLTTNFISIFLCSGMIGASIYYLRNFLRKTPKELLVSFHGSNEKTKEAEQEPGFFEGLRILLKHWYLLAIFGVLSFFEIIVTIFDVHFQTLAETQYSGVELSKYMGSYGSAVNVVAFLCLLLGVGNISRKLGVGVALILMPFIYAGAIVGFLSFKSLSFLFWLMVSSKAINYALNGPAIKQLYIPTTHDTRFKAQAWIETFGSRGSKEAGSMFNFLLPVVGRARHVVLSAYLGFTLVIAWFFVALYLGRTYKHAIDNKKVVC
jgi:AAA family ATP:ADP antiporter